MGEEQDVGVLERVKGFFRSKPIRPSDKVDQYITGNLPDLIEEYKLALRKDLGGVDEKIEEFVDEVTEMNEWKEDTEERLEEARKRVKRLEKKHGIKGD